MEYICSFLNQFNDKDTSLHFNIVRGIEGYPGNKFFFHTLLFATQYILLATNWLKNAPQNHNEVLRGAQRPG